MLSEESVVEEQTDVIFVADEHVSSEEPSMSEWSSLVFDAPLVNKKKNQNEQGLYDPGSGEICTKHIAMSDSAVFRHPYYAYPAILDPEIKKALFQPEIPVIYPDDGQELYLAICKEMEQAPVRKFYQGLLQEEIDLKYYCVDPRGVRPMAIALSNNKTVKVFSLIDNFLTDDACYHLGEMLMSNITLQNLNLSGCRIKPSGVQRLMRGLLLNKYLHSLNLNKNKLGDDGVEYIANAVIEGLSIKNIYLSYNNIGARGAEAFAEAFKKNNNFVELDLSWNKLFETGPTYGLLAILSENKFLQDINLSWNSLAGARLGTATKLLLNARNLRNLNMSDNKLEGEAVSNLIKDLEIAKNLDTLDLSFNPLSPNDALNVLKKLKSGAVKVRNVLLGNIYVTSKFVTLLRTIKKIKGKENLLVTYGGVISFYKGVCPDPRDLLLDRAEYLTKKQKKPSINIALFILQLARDVTSMPGAEFATLLEKSKVRLDEDLIDEIVTTFSGSRNPKVKVVNIQMLADYVRRKWPERELPPPVETEAVPT